MFKRTEQKDPHNETMNLVKNKSSYGEGAIYNQQGDQREKCPSNLSPLILHN